MGDRGVSYGQVGVHGGVFSSRWLYDLYHGHMLDGIPVLPGDLPQDLSSVIELAKIVDKGGSEIINGDVRRRALVRWSI